jgi:hypothetical protein
VIESSNRAETGASPSSIGADLLRDGAVLIEPNADAWREQIAASWARTQRDPVALRARAELGLPTDRPIVMSGHQTMFWHPGILAKWYAMNAAARAVHGATAWVAVDHDTDDPTAIAYPRQLDGGIDREVWHWTTAYLHDVPPVMQKSAGAIDSPKSEAGIASVDAGLRAISEAVSGSQAGFQPALQSGNEANASLAHRVMNATASLVGGPAPVIAYASELARSPAFASLVERMSKDPEACVEAYNAAARKHPASGLRELSADVVNDRWELPLWRLVDTGPRERVYAEELDPARASSKQKLAPRAILLTGFLRRYICDLFIHGMGGGVYDRACDDWFATWLPGEPLAPTAVVSATLRLKFDGVASLSPGESTAARARAMWKVQHAFHNPGVIGDQKQQDTKRGDARAISTLARNGPERRRAYVAMHDRLAAYRKEHAAQLSTLQTDLARIDRAVTTSVQEQARDWPFPLYPQGRLTELRTQIDRAFGL